MKRDNRLDLVNYDDQLEVLPAYRMWSDSQLLVVPKGYSTTKPLQPEQIQANVNVYGNFEKGFFNPPCVQFKNTTNRLPFDSFCLAVNRPEFTPEWKQATIQFTLSLVVDSTHFVQDIQTHTVYKGLNTFNYKISNDEYDFMCDFRLSTNYSSTGFFNENVDLLTYRFKNTTFKPLDYTWVLETEVLNVTS